MKSSKVLFAGFLMLALSAPTASVFAGDKLKSPSTKNMAPNQTTEAPKQTNPSVRSWYRPKVKSLKLSPTINVMRGKIPCSSPCEEEDLMPRAGRLTIETPVSRVSPTINVMRGKIPGSFSFDEADAMFGRLTVETPVSRVDGGPGKDNQKYAPLVPEEFIIIR